MTAKVRDLFVGTLNTNVQGRTADVGGTWGVANSTGSLNSKLGGDGTMYNTDSLDRAVNSTPTSANDRVKIRGKMFQSPGQFGVAVRLQSATGAAGYYFVIQQTGWDFFRLAAGGAYTSIASNTTMSIPLNEWHTAEVVPSGNSFSLYLDNTLVGSPTDSTYPAGGFSGMHVRNSNVDWIEAGDAGDPDPEGGSAPTITSHPSAQSVTAGSTATFSVTATGATSYQWQRMPSGGSWANVTTGTGGTTSSYTTAATTVSGGNANDGDSYRCVATNGSGSTNSNAATLTVTAGAVAPAFSTQPSNQTVTTPNTASFTVVVTGTPTPTLQWQRSTDGGSNWNNVTTGTGATSSTYTTAATSVSGGAANNGDRYRCVAQNSAGTTNSNGAILTVNAAATGTLTFTDALVNINGGVLALATGVTYLIQTLAGTTVLTKTGQTTNGSGIPASVSDAALTTGTTYRVIFIISGGAEGMLNVVAG